MRNFTEYTDELVKSLLAKLVSDQVTPEIYRQTMHELGRQLAERMRTRLCAKDEIMLICTNDDADFLARGVLDGLMASGHNCIHLACFWNERLKLTPNTDLAPIVRSYIEDADKVDVFVVVKSIISGGCVVRTNINELIGDYSPRQIMIASPVLLQGAEQGLTEDFASEIVAKFQYFYFAKDNSKKPDGNVDPGIGGSVYELLGIGDSHTKNRYTPQLVKSRRAKVSTT